MFTGIIQTTGKVAKTEEKDGGINFKVSPEDSKFLKDVNIGDSIAINGACMTVESCTPKSFTFTTIEESLKKTNLGSLEKGSLVNLEKSLTFNSKLDGHIVQGHIDTTGIVEFINELGTSWEYYITFPSSYRANIIKVGSIAINGVSLTIAEIVSEYKSNITIKVAIIPHTYEVTNLKYLASGSAVNIEFDMLGKYAIRALQKVRS